MKASIAAAVTLSSMVVVSAQEGAPRSLSYTAAQAGRGADIYRDRCASCHGDDVGGDGNGITPALFGPVFVGNWGGLPLASLADRVRLESQQSTAAALSRRQQADVVAFLLEKNEAAPGDRELPADVEVLGRVRLTDVLNQAKTDAVAAPQNYPPAFPRKNATLLFQTDRVAVWDIVWPKGEPTPMHRHLYDQVGTYYAPGGRRITTPDGQSRLTSTPAGALSNTRAGTTHIEEGTTDPPLRAVFIELRRVPDGTAAAARSGIPEAFRAGAAKQVLDDNRVTVWDCTWPAGGGPVTLARSRDTVIVWLNAARVRTSAPGSPGDVRDLRPGMAEHGRRGETTVVTAVDGVPHVMLFELK
jgi:mono/diheme cytochrome c family protein